MTPRPPGTGQASRASRSVRPSGISTRLSAANGSAERPCGAPDDLPQRFAPDYKDRPRAPGTVAGKRRILRSWPALSGEPSAISDLPRPVRMGLVRVLDVDEQRLGI